jgi:hypothetical protein
LTNDLFLGHQRTTGLELLHSARLEGQDKFPNLPIAAQAIDITQSEDTVWLWIEKERVANSVLAELNQNALIAVGFSARKAKLESAPSARQLKRVEGGLDCFSLALTTKRSGGEKREQSKYDHSRRLTDGR